MHTKLFAAAALVLTIAPATAGTVIRQEIVASTNSLNEVRVNAGLSDFVKYQFGAYAIIDYVTNVFPYEDGVRWEYDVGSSFWYVGSLGSGAELTGANLPLVKPKYTLSDDELVFRVGSFTGFTNWIGDGGYIKYVFRPTRIWIEVELADGYDPAGLDVDLIYLRQMPSAPEPASWAMMIAGFGLVGAMARRRISAAPRA